MYAPLTFIRIFFLILCVFFSTLYILSQRTEEFGVFQLLMGILGGLAFGYTVINLEQFFKRFNLRSFNTVILGLFFGYLMGQAILFIVSAAFSPIPTQMSSELISFMRMGLFLVTAYFGISMTMRNSEEFYFSIPFVNLRPSGDQRKDLIIDQSVLSDSRLIDLATSGLLDSQLIIPRYLVRELAEKADSIDEMEKQKARRCQETIKRLESITNIELRYSEMDFPELTDLMQKNVELARLLNANIFITDANRVSQSKLEGIRLINIYILSNAFKPLAHLGEYINIKIQRFGKDPRQGVGYLEDGTMVVVNGGAEFIGETIRVQVLSVKQTSSGRMIFCNVNEVSSSQENVLAGLSANSSIKDFGNKEIESLIKNYYPEIK